MNTDCNYQAVSCDYFKVNEVVSEKLIEAWKEWLTAEASYKKSSRQDAESRRLDIHALFLSDNIWYCRAYCHTREAFSNFCLHKFTDITLSDTHFIRSAEVIQNLKNGSLFNTKNIYAVKALCEPSVADYINDREWFPKQQSHFHENGHLEIWLKSVI